MTPGEFCRDLEAYLCRKNDGHLIRIVGPTFEKVCGWATQGVPIKVAFRGIDRYFDRQQAKGPSRRPIRVEFCEADILDAFDEWRRAVGVTAGGSGTSSASAPGNGGAPPDDAAAGTGHAKRKPGLQTHIDRVMARLTQRRVDSNLGPLGEIIDRVLGELDTLRAGARGARQDARAEVLARLTAIDRALLDAARATLDAAALTDLRREAQRELEPFRSRMTPDAWRDATEAALDRLVRERCRLPDVGE